MFKRKLDMIFKKRGKERSAADTYCKALKALVTVTADRWNHVLDFCRKGQFYAHGTRNGSATHVTTGTMEMEPPPIPW